DLERLLIERTQGNPFFLEESVRTLVEARALIGERGTYRLAGPIRTLELPATAQAILAARIDRLAPEDKRLLQAAAGVGKDVSYPLLQAVAEEPEESVRQSLARLQAAEFLYEARLFPEVEYTFKHALTHEVAYGGLIHDRRAALHARIVEAMEHLYVEHLDEHVERLAHHAVRGEVRERALRYLQQAGTKAAAQWALQDARGWFEQALDVLQTLTESRSTLEQAVDIRLALREALVVLGEGRHALQRIREAETFGDTLNDDERRGRVWALRATSHCNLGEFDEALTYGTRTLDIARARGDVRLRCIAANSLEQVHYCRGEYEQVIEVATDTLRALGDLAHESFILGRPASVSERAYIMVSLAQLGRFRAAAQCEAEMVQFAEATHAYGIGWAHLFACDFRLVEGDWAKAHLRIEHAIAMIRTGNVGQILALAISSAAGVRAQHGPASEASHRLQEGEQLLERRAARGVAAWQGGAYHALGRAALLLGRLDEAQRLGDRAVESSPAQATFLAPALHLLGDI